MTGAAGVDPLIRQYSVFVSRHPWLIILLVIFFTFMAFQGVSKLQFSGTSFNDMFPSDLDVVQSLVTIQDEFMGSSSINIVIQGDPDYSRGDIVDMRDPRVIEYSQVLAKRAETIDNVLESQSLADVLIPQNGGVMPGSTSSSTLLIEENPNALNFISRDYSILLVRLNLGDVDGKEEALMANLDFILDTTPAPPGIVAAPAGDPAIAVTFKELTGPDMAKTTKYSLLGILVLTMIIFSSIRYSFLPLVSVGIGTFWAFGLMGLLDIRISSQMAGVSSMVLGIGIDFAIQVINRYRQEREGILYDGSSDLTPPQALMETLPNVIPPMSITTLAALIGFRAMSLGQLQFMQDLGIVMSLGVLTSMFSAITLVPAIIIISERFYFKGGKKDES